MILERRGIQESWLIFASSRMADPNEHEKQRQQEACLGEQVAPNLTQKKEAYRM